MSMATRADTQSPGLHWRQPRSIRVHGARVNNLKDVSVEILKATFDGIHRRLRLGQELAGVQVRSPWSPSG